MNHRNVRIAFVGLGERGLKALGLMLPVEGAKVVGLCDVRPTCVDAARELVPDCLLSATGQEGFREICRSEEVDLVYVCSDWSSHARIAVEAMRCGKHVAVEVPGALTMDDIYELLRTSRATGCHCALLENCCYDPQFVNALEAIRRGDIGELVHAEGTYYHCLGDRWSAWRLEMNRQWRGDLYPTHELGPICMAMGIGHTDRLHTLVCMDSAPLTGLEVYEKHTGRAAPDFCNGDHTTTLIRTERGRTILLRHDVLTAQPYDRQLTFVGTRGRIQITDAGHESHEEMTMAMNRDLIRRLANGLPMSIDVGELATWCAAIPLSRLSIERGFAPVAYPDFGTC